MYLTLAEALSFHNSQLDTYYSLWVFFFTASIGIVGFFYGSSQVRESLLAKASATVIYLALVIGNHHAITSTNNLLNELKTNIQLTSKHPQQEGVEVSAAVKLLQDNSLDVPSRVAALIGDGFYLFLVLFVIGGIWCSSMVVRTAES
ncbi:hypothetical protein [Motiliproteus sediminis]|uniref:hypothetical protein n=1 Tax=Motiliproteus sediminis TaxID=1468178 RepID=UPI001AEF959C|nr:hypothetical protein [Motiliproteus sediminis]